MRDKKFENAMNILMESLKYSIEGNQCMEKGDQGSTEIAQIIHELADQVEKRSISEKTILIMLEEIKQWTGEMLKIIQDNEDVQYKNDNR